MGFYLSKAFKASAFMTVAVIFTALFSCGVVFAASEDVDPVKQAAWEAAQADAIVRVSDFDDAVKSGSPEKIRKVGLELQSDPVAVQMMNQSRPDLVETHNELTKTIKSDAKEKIRDNMAKEWNKTHPDDPPITRDEVDIYEPTNYKDPDAKPKSGQDWDVTVRVKGKDVPPAKSKKVVEKAYYDAAGGEKTFGKRAQGVTKEQAASAVAHRQAVETTHGKSAEAYNEPEIILGVEGKKPETGKALADPEQLTHAIENKSFQARNKAKKAAAAGNMTETVTQEFEQMRQASKQYDKITKPRVEAAGGTVHPKVDEGMSVLRDAGSVKISPEQARAKLAQMGETPESIIGKASGQAEAAQKFKSLSKERVSIKSKALEATGTVMTGIDIGSTAEDIKENLKNGDLEGAATVVGGAAANQVTGGGYGTVKAAKEKYDDYTEAQKELANANRQNEVAYNLKVEKELQRAGVKPAEVKKIMDARASGDDSALENKFKKLGIEPPEKIVENPVEGDDTATERTIAIGTGMVDSAKKTGKFLDEATDDVAEIGVGMLEKGVASEVASQTKENINDGYETYQENKNAEKKTEDVKQDVQARLIAKGATPEGAKKAADALIDHGDSSKIKRLDALLDSRSKKNAASDPKESNAGWGSALSNGVQNIKAAAAKGSVTAKNVYDKYKADAEKAKKEKAESAKIAAEAKARDEKRAAEEVEAKLDADFTFTPAASSGSPAAKPRISSPTDGTIAQFLGSWMGKFDEQPLTLTFSTNEPPTREMKFNERFHGTATIDGVVEFVVSMERLRWPAAQGYTISYSNAQRTFPCNYSNKAFSIEWTPLVTITRSWVDGEVQTISEDIYFSIWGRIEDDGMFHGRLTPGSGDILWEARKG